jgi:hypothetical protein
MIRVQELRNPLKAKAGAECFHASAQIKADKHPTYIKYYCFRHILSHSKAANLRIYGGFGKRETRKRISQLAAGVW